MKVYVIMDHWLHDDDGNSDNDVEAVHSSREGAQDALKPEYGSIDTTGGIRAQHIVEMELLP